MMSPRLMLLGFLTFSPLCAAASLLGFPLSLCELRSWNDQRRLLDTTGQQLRWTSEVNGEQTYPAFRVKDPDLKTLFIGRSHIREIRTGLQLAVKANRLQIFYPSEGKYFSSLSFEIPPALQTIATPNEGEESDLRRVSYDKLTEFWKSEVEDKITKRLEALILVQIMHEAAALFPGTISLTDLGDRVSWAKNAAQELLHERHVDTWERKTTSIRRNLVVSRLGTWKLSKAQYDAGMLAGLVFNDWHLGRELSISIENAAVRICARARRREEVCRRQALTEFMKLESYLQNVPIIEVILGSFNHYARKNPISEH